MGKINLGSVVLGGLVAGVVLNIVDYLVFAVVLKLPVTSGQLIWFVILDFVYGIGLVWVYAAVRPRFNPGPDRKSTRLNSSHGYISYAVFCLKKKKKKHTNPISVAFTVMQPIHGL